MSRENLRKEIADNLYQIRFRVLHVLPKLLDRYFFSKNKRTTELSYSVHDKYWNDFWSKRDIFRTDLPITMFDRPMIKLSPFDFKKSGIVKILAEKISQYNISSVLEVGSGAGLNLMLLAPMFPHVSFAGLEPTESGVRVTNEFIKCPPPEFEAAHQIGKVENIQVIKGSILDNAVIKELEHQHFDLVYTSAVLEQLYNYIDIAFENIFGLTSKYFLFYEEWLEANYLLSNYLTLVDSDYFRVPWNYLNKYKDIEILERSIPGIQPAWLKYGVVFGKKICQ